MAEWLIEEGIGESRALLIENDQVVGAKLFWPGECFAGQIDGANLASKASGSRRGTAVLGNGTEVLVDRLPSDLTEGAKFALQITRAPIAERGRLKMAQARFVEDSEQPTTNPLPQGETVRRFPCGMWEDVWDAASSAQIDFSGGSLLISTSPAMTLIDIDGAGSPRELALAAVPAIAEALRWFDIGGSIGIDFPTIQDKLGRKQVDAALEAALSNWPHERTAMNGFGFVQLVARLEGPSLLHRFEASRVGACARVALRRAEMAEGSGRVLLLTVHPALKAKLKEEWLIELSRRTGKEVRIETNPSLALEAAQAQIIAQ
ncbi:ribonuclease E/G [Erythrobacter crassostreae]|uniref:Ribonuclease E/G n=1 Tax=Erythrobacter crassostreae TaxID=2828328 RepID=A0A9X1F625_9SPHN|nr:ribonuclease E/G [Erythrobacter crassostrea]MBV7259490.1 ribonuclease E/G [Erythrobacter crassostrea]